MLKKLRAYTLIELLMVMTIIGMMAVLAVPAFATYSRKEEVAQKASDVVALLKRGYILSKNPDKNVSFYQITVATGDINSVFLTSSTGSGSTPEQVDKVTGEKNQIFNCRLGCPTLTFPTDADSGWSVAISGSAYTGSELFELTGVDSYIVNISTGGTLYNVTAARM